MQWKYMTWKGRWLYILFFVIILTLVVAQKIGDPYKILGIHRKATLPEIRKAYRQLAKEWHPDKNEDPNAETRFVEIKQAYELLSDSERRQAYDLYGITNEDDHMYKQRHDYSQYARFSNDPFEYFSTHFRTQDQDITLFHKLSVTSRHFENNILEKSVHTPAIVLFYTDWCFDCVRSASTWRRLVEALQPLGVTMATVHAGHESSLTRRIGVHGVPCLTVILDKQVYIYKESLTLAKILDFFRWKFPYKMVKSLNDNNVGAFVSDFEDNKVKALIFEERQNIRLRYLITAFHYRERVSFAFIDITARDTQNVTGQYKVQRSMDTMILLKEDSEEPAATVSTTEIPTQTLRQLIEANQMLTLPRLSSQSVLEAVCPVEWRAARRRLCCVVVARGAPLPLPLRPLRALARRAPDRIRYAYLYATTQPDFVNALANASGMDTSTLEHRIVIIWRRESSRIQYEWLNETWPTCNKCHPDEYEEGSARGEEAIRYHERLNETKRALEQLVKRLLKPTEVVAYETHVQELVDEAARGAVWRAAAAALEWAERALGALRSHHALGALSVLATVAAVLAAAYCMAHLVRVEEESVQREKEALRQKNSNSSNNNDPKPEMRLHELRAEKYNGLVRLQRPGCRTIVLLVDKQSRAQLLSKFHKIVWPYRKNKTLVFAYLCVERNVEWFRRVLQLSLGGGGELRVNGRNCVGTVLALNPHRKYFCIYHAKHPECAKPHKRMNRMTRSLGGRAAAGDPEAGAFIGFTSDPDSSADDDYDPPLLLQENLLDGLENWLDRLFEGSTHRYYVNYWPDMTTK